MIELISRTRRRNHSGFTLIELLVVIIILGVLSAVVVFAVRGANDKGRENAILTEAKILRTAQEAYCARENKYAASASELKEKRYLSSDPGYHTILTTPGSNNCNGTSYTIDTIPNPGAEPDPGWRRASAPVKMQVYDTVELEDGRVLATGMIDDGGSLNKAAIWDPTKTSPEGLPGVWTSIQPNYAHGQDLMPIGLITGPRCGDHCGKAMYYFRFRSEFEFYNPAPPPPPSELAPGVTLPVTTTTIKSPLCPCDDRGAQWERVPNSNTAGYGQHRIAGAKLLTTNCGDHCGKMLIVPRFCPWSGCNPAQNRPVLYDPQTNSFAYVPYPPMFDTIIKNFEIAPLADGRVLFFNSAAAAMWDPAPMTDSVGAPVPVDSPVRWSAAALPNNSHAHDPTDFWARTYQVLEGPGLQGRVFVENEIFTPPPRGSSDLGSWGGVTECQGGCLAVGFAGQKILGLLGGPAGPASFLLDPDLKTWQDTPNAPFSNDTMSFPRAVRLTGGGTGSCGQHCGKILVTGKSSAELYVPA